MGTYFFRVIQTHHHTGECIGVTTGVVLADNESEAKEKAWLLAGNDNSGKVEVEEVDIEQGYKYTVCK